MPIVRFLINGYRGFADEQVLKLAVPSGAAGSGLTVLVGPNNGGKSSVIEGLRVLSQRKPTSISDGKRNKQAGDVVRFQIVRDDGKKVELKSISQGTSETEWEDSSGRDGLEIFVVQARRTFNPQFSKTEVDRSTYIVNWGIPQNRSAQVDQFASRLFAIHKSEETRRRFETELSKVLGWVPRWSIDMSDGGSYFLKFVLSTHQHTSEGLGDGLVSLFFIVDALYDSAPGSLIVIDEPELSLHPPLQRKLRELLSDYSRDRQVVYATHSPLMLDWFDVVNGASVARLWKEEEGCRIAQLSPETGSRVESLLENLNNPHILGLDATSVFFLEDGVVLVEGQEDVVSYRTVLSQLGMKLTGAFFGWGVGGAGNMALIADLLRDLGFKRVSGILDSGQESVVQDLRRLFPTYHFDTIPAPDVRTKPERPISPAKRGLLDEQLQLRPEYEDEIRQSLTRVEEFLSRRD